MTDICEEYLEWVDSRPSDRAWLWKAGHFGKTENERLWNEIPDELKPIVGMVMNLALESQKRGIGGKSESSCMLFRNMLYATKRRLEESSDVRIPISHYWYMDGIMIEPMEIVRLCNGLLGWTGDSGCSECGLDECPFRGKP